MTPLALLLVLQLLPQVVLGEYSFSFLHDGIDTKGYLLCVASTGECRDQAVTDVAGEKRFVAPSWLPRGEQSLWMVAVGTNEINSAPGPAASFRVFIRPGRPGPLSVVPGGNEE
jgi:hypothetical protein